MARSACAHALQAGLHWPTALKRLVFLGTPHAGAPLERAGSWVDTLLDLSPYTAPFSRLGKLRSAGIQDLRHGHAMDADVPLPPGVRCWVLATKFSYDTGPVGGELASAVLGAGDPRIEGVVLLGAGPVEQIGSAPMVVARW